MEEVTSSTGIELRDETCYKIQRTALILLAGLQRAVERLANIAVVLRRKSERRNLTQNSAWMKGLLSCKREIVCPRG